MRTTPETIDSLLHLLTPMVDDVRAQKMFGEYALYRNEKVVALVCRDELVVKATPQGEAFANDLEHRSAYPGAKPGLHVPKNRWGDGTWLAELIRITADSLPSKK
jgi:DNA transformation protein